MDAVRPPFLLPEGAGFWGDTSVASKVQVYCKRFAKIETGQGESGIIGAERGGVAAKGVYGNEKTDFSDFGALHGVIGMHEGGSGESADCGERGGFFRGKHRERRGECGE